ncbi:hypothetical protein EDD21DRAFT_384225 [Dissophora ornata]|nr:hypothetical protein BGZ58_001409 [Dissophora ornata]KAI8597871.1 hypothetical protein EDD21DRAFT_384225 [Dissophora ornata]
MSKKALPLSSLALLLSTAASVEALTWSEASTYLTQGLQPILSSAALTSTNKHVLQARRLQKRYDVCSYYGDIYYYCNSPTHCTSDTTCSFNYTWVIIVVVLIVVIVVSILLCRRRRNQNNVVASNQMVMTSIVPAPGPGNTTSVTYQPQVNYGPGVQNAIPMNNGVYDPNQPMNNGAYDPNQVQNLQYPSAYATPAGYAPVPPNVQPGQQQQQQYAYSEAPFSPVPSAAAGSAPMSPPNLAAPYSPYPSEQPTPSLATAYSPYPSEHSQTVVQPSPLAQSQHLDYAAKQPDYSAYPQQQQQYYTPPVEVSQPMMPVGTVAGTPLQYQGRQPQYYGAYDPNAAALAGAAGAQPTQPRQPQNPQQSQ